MTPLETEADPNIRVGPLRWGRPSITTNDWILLLNLRKEIPKHFWFKRFKKCFVFTEEVIESMYGVLK